MNSMVDIVRAFNLKKSGNAYTGACPSCGYPSGFSLQDKHGRPLFYCHAGGCSQKELLSVFKSKVMGRINYQKQIVTSPPAKIANSAKKKETQVFVDSIWHNCLPAQNTPVQTYLAARGYRGVIPNTLKFHPKLWHQATQQKYPAMVAAVTDIEGNSRPQALHRTFLTLGGKHKAQIEPNKMTLGSVKGLSVHLAEATKQLAITEGLETGLSIWMATSIPTWVALSAGGIQNLILPPLPLAREIWICADHDPVGLKAAYHVAEKWFASGRIVRVCKPPQLGSDFNDLLCSASESARIAP